MNLDRCKLFTMNSQRMGAHIEIVEPYTTENGGEDVDALPAIKPTVVRINGTDVGLLEDIDVMLMGSGATKVVLTLLPRSVTIKAE